MAVMKVNVSSLLQAVTDLSTLIIGPGGDVPCAGPQRHRSVRL